MWDWFMSLFRRKSVDKEKLEPTLQEQRDAFIKKTQSAYLEQVAKSLAERQERNLSSPLPDIPMRLQSRDELHVARMRRAENERRERQNWRGSTTGDVRGPRGNSDLPHPNRRSTDTPDQTLSTLLILNATNTFEPEPSRDTCEPSRSYESPSRDCGGYDPSPSDSGGGDSGGGD
jgi:hypothetical protein